MSKKIISILLAILIVLSLSACSNKDNSTVATPNNGGGGGSVTDTSDTNQGSDNNSENKEENEMPYGNYTNSFRFTGSEEDFQSEKYKNANFKTLNMHTSFAYGIQEVTISDSIVNKELNNAITELTYQINTAKKGTSLINKIADYENFVTYFNADFEFVKSLIPISSKIKVRPYNVSKQGEIRAQEITMDYMDSRLSGTSDYFSSMTFLYNKSITIENQKGNFKFVFYRITGTDDQILPFGGKTVKVSVSGTSNVKSNLTATYENGTIVLKSDNPDFYITELSISSEDKIGLEQMQKEYSVRDKTEFIIKPIDDLKVEVSGK